MNNIRYESTNLLEDNLVFSVTIAGVKYTVTTDYNFNVINVCSPISIKEWIKEGCPNNVILPEAPFLIKEASQQKIRNWWYKNKNYFDNFYSSKAKVTYIN